VHVGWEATDERTLDHGVDQGYLPGGDLVLVQREPNLRPPRPILLLLLLLLL
jgi:hypothetical protein